MLHKNRKSVLDPIDVVTGECYVERIDFSLPGPIPVEWGAYYSNQLKLDGPLGWGWTYSFHRYLVFNETYAAYVDEHGSVSPFLSIPEVGDEAQSADSRLLLRRNDEDSFEVVLADGLILLFRGSPLSGRARLERISNLNGRSITLFYDRSGRLNRIVDSAGRTLELRLDRQGRILYVNCSRQGDSPGLMRLVEYRYDRNGNLVTVIDANGNTYRYEYDAQHQMLKKTDRNGYSFNYRYWDDRCVRVWGDDGLYTANFTYEPEEQRTLYEGFDGRRIEYCYDKEGLVNEEVDPYGRVTKTQYDQNGNASVVTDRCDRAAVSKCDDRGNKLEEMSPTGQITKRSFNDRSQLTEEIDPRKERTAYEYDDRGNLIQEEFPGGSTASHEYDEEGDEFCTRLPGQPVEEKEYDEHHQLIVIRDRVNKGDAARYEYDLLGNVLGMWDYSGWTRYVYDRMSRLLEVHHPDGSVEKNTFDPEGNVTSYTDRLGRTWQYSYKAREQMIEMIAPDGGLTKYDYTRANELCLVVDPNGNRTEYRYDLCDRIAEIRQNGAVIDRYSNDPEGRLIEKRGARDEILVNRVYDSWEGPIARTVAWSDERCDSILDYDEHGQVIGTQNRFARTERSYDSLGRIVSERLNEEVVEHEYDGQGGLVETAFGDHAAFRLRYDGVTVTITDPCGNEHKWALDGSRVRECSLANGIKESLDFDEEGRITRHVIRKGEGNSGVLLNRSYTYSVLGELIGLREPGTERSFDYDPCGRLTRVNIRESHNPWRDNERFVYDSAGNLLPLGNDQLLSVHSGNQLITWGDRRFSYDNRGCLSIETRGVEAYRYTYDSADQLISVELPDGRVVDYEYDARGRRVSKQIGDQRTIFGWDGERLSWELSPDGTYRCYFYARPDDIRPAMFCDATPVADGEWSLEVYFVHYDQANRPILITDNEGDVVWSADVAAYGKTTVHADSTMEYNLRAPGQYYDAETGLHYNYYRYYDPEIGRYIQPDPIGLGGGLNTYAYGTGNPFAVCDLRGLEDG